jgi:hypothetical protein
LVQSDERRTLVMVRIGAAAFDGVDRHGRINPTSPIRPAILRFSPGK